MFRAWALLVALVAGCLPAACADPSDLGPSPGTSPQPRGGTLRIVLPAGDIFSDRISNPEPDPATLDPALDGLSALTTWELMRCCLSRSLLSNNGRATEQGGARIHPDLAEEYPQVSDDGLQWTFRLRHGVHFAPPFSGFEVTAQDVIRGFHRALSPTFHADIAPLFADIVGAADYAAGEAATISGLESPASDTLVVRLTSPAGDFAPRLALPWVVPIPASPSDPNAPLGVATGHDDGYGRFFVSSGPYMIEGSEALDFMRPAAEQLPVSGLIPGQSLVLVRNPSWDEATDPLRPALPDRIEFRVLPSLDDAVTAVLEGGAEVLVNPQLPNMSTDAADRVRASNGRVQLFVNQSDFVGQILMNTAQPPFDDIHVRRAANFLVDKAHLGALAGGPLVFRPAHHLVPDAMEDNLLVDYQPYASVGDSGDLEQARREMALSRYDTDGDGGCDAVECAGAVILTRGEPNPPIGQAVRDAFAQIGIDLTLDVRPTDEFFEMFFDPSNHIAVFAPLAWAKDSLSPAGFFIGQFYSPAVGSGGNGTLIGASSEQLAAWGYAATEVPNVDARIEACLPLTGAAQFECWAGLDQYMMENVVPSIPWGLGLGVVVASSSAEFVWDQLAAAPSYDQIALPH